MKYTVTDFRYDYLIANDFCRILSIINFIDLLPGGNHTWCGLGLSITRGICIIMPGAGDQIFPPFSMSFSNCAKIKEGQNSL